MACVTPIRELSIAAATDDAIASVAVNAFLQDSNLTDLFELTSTASGAMETALACLEDLSSSERRVLVFALNLVKDIAMAKAVAIARSPA